MTARVSPHAPRHPEPRRRPRDLSEALCGIVNTKPVLQLQRLHPSIPRLRRDPSAALRRLGMTGMLCADLMVLENQRSGGGRCPPNPEVRERSPAF